jgi:hypothetical protein
LTTLIPEKHPMNADREDRGERQPLGEGAPYPTEPRRGRPIAPAQGMTAPPSKKWSGKESIQLTPIVRYVVRAVAMVLDRYLQQGQTRVRLSHTD